MIGRTPSRTAFSTSSRLSEIISNCRSLAISRRSSDATMSITLDRACVTLRTVWKNRSGSVTRPLAYTSMISRFLSDVSSDSAGASKMSRRFSNLVTLSISGALTYSPALLIERCGSPSRVMIASSVSSTTTNTCGNIIADSTSRVMSSVARNLMVSLNPPAGSWRMARSAPAPAERTGFGSPRSGSAAARDLRPLRHPR